MWRVGAARDLDIVDRTWNGADATKRVFAWAGFDGDDPDPAQARRAFLAYDDERPEVRASYKLPFADVVDGELVAVTGGLRAAASRLPQADLPDDVKERARALLDRYFERLNSEDEEKTIVAGRQVKRMERKAAPQVIEQIEGRTVTGIASVIGIVDDGGDLVEPGAFRKTIAERSHRFRWLWQHDDKQPPIAVIESVEEVGRDALPPEILESYPEAKGGLRVTRRYLDTPRANEVLEAIKAGAVDELSYGYDAVRAAPGNGLTVGGRKARRRLQEVRLWEFSDVNWGMNPATTNTDIKAARPEEAKAMMEWLESRIHLEFTRIADDLFGDGFLTREERIALSGLIGDALDAFHAGFVANEDLARLRRTGFEMVQNNEMEMMASLELLERELALLEV